MTKIRLDAKWRAAACVCLLASWARAAAAQQEFPLDRPILPATPVSDLGTVPLATGGTLPFGFLTAFATADMRGYPEIVETKFAYSLGVEPPKDSLHTANEDRLNTWLTRVKPGAKGVTPQMLVAELDKAAGHDSAAQQIYAKLLATSMTTPMERVYVMKTACEAAASFRDDTVHLRRTLPVARHYLALIEALPRVGHATEHDSLEVLDAVVSDERAMEDAVEAFGNADSVMVEAHHRFHVAAELPWAQRTSLWQAGSYDLFAGKPQGQARMDSIQATAKQLVTMTAAERAMGDNPGRRAAQERDQLDRVAHMWDHHVIYAHPAPGIPAHAWLNTSDSLYQPTPRTRAPAPGQIRLIFPGGSDDGNAMYFLQHLQAKLPEAAFSVITSTEGAEGDVLSEPADEVVWRQNTYEHIMHVQIPVAMWAGAKQAALYGGRRPADRPPWPEDQGYWDVTITDTHAVVRGYCRYADWDGDDCITRVVHYLGAEAKGNADPTLVHKDDLLPLRDTTSTLFGGTKPTATPAH